MKTWLVATAGLAGAAAIACGCSGASPTEAPPDTGGDASVADAGDAGDAGDGSDGASTAAYVRVAHWSPDAPAVDVCFAPGSSDFEGQLPRLGPALGPGDAGDGGGQSNATDGGAADGSAADGSVADGSAADGSAVEAGAPGLSFQRLTSYLVLPPGSYGVRLVAAGATDCSKPVTGLDGVALAAGSHTTIAAVGEQTPAGNDQALKLVALPDDVGAPPGQIALRFVNADASAGASSVDFGTGSLAGASGAYAGLVSGVPFGASSSSGTSDAGAIDIHGYELGLPLAGATLSAHVTAAASDVATATNSVTVGAGSAASVVLLGGGSTKAGLVLCADGGDGDATVQIASCAPISP